MRRDKDTTKRMALKKLGRRVDPVVALRKPNIHQDEIRLLLGSQAEGVFGIGRDADHGEPGFGQQVFILETDEVIIFDDQNAARSISWNGAPLALRRQTTHGPARSSNQRSEFGSIPIRFERVDRPHAHHAVGSIVFDRSGARNNQGRVREAVEEKMEVERLGRHRSGHADIAGGFLEADEISQAAGGFANRTPQDNVALKCNFGSSRHGDAPHAVLRGDAIYCAEHHAGS